jgi:hypothetical protein
MHGLLADVNVQGLRVTLGRGHATATIPRAR